MVTINKNAILLIEDEEDVYIIRMLDVAQTVYKCPKTIKMERKHYYPFFNLHYDEAERDVIDNVDLRSFISYSNCQFIDLPDGTEEE